MKGISAKSEITMSFCWQVFTIWVDVPGNCFLTKIRMMQLCIMYGWSHIQYFLNINTTNTWKLSVHGVVMSSSMMIIMMVYCPRWWRSNRKCWYYWESTLITTMYLLYLVCLLGPFQISLRFFWRYGAAFLRSHKQMVHRRGWIMQNMVTFPSFFCWQLFL